MNFINYAIPVVILSFSLTSYSESVPASQPKTKLQICAEKKLKDFRVRNLVSISDEPIYLDKFKQVCAKEQMANNSDKQAADAAARAEKEKEKQQVASPTKPASGDSSTGGVKPVTGGTKPATPGTNTGSSASSGFVIGGCGTPEQCAEFMAYNRTPRYTWTAPAMQAYLGELWGDSYHHAHIMGGHFEQPQNACNEKNQGELIALDTGTELVAVACMSNQASQEEIKKMAQKIKNVKVDTLPVVVAVKQPKYEWKIIEEQAKIEDGRILICKGPGTCTDGEVGQTFSGGAGCALIKCIRIDGGPVKTAKKDEKKDEKKEEKKDDPIVEIKPVSPIKNEREPAEAHQAQPYYKSFDVERDGAAGM